MNFLLSKFDLCISPLQHDRVASAYDPMLRCERPTRDIGRPPPNVVLCRLEQAKRRHRTTAMDRNPCGLERNGYLFGVGPGPSCVVTAASQRGQQMDDPKLLRGSCHELERKGRESRSDRYSLRNALEERVAPRLAKVKYRYS